MNERPSCNSLPAHASLQNPGSQFGPLLGALCPDRAPRRRGLLICAPTFLIERPPSSARYTAHRRVSSPSRAVVQVCEMRSWEKSGRRRFVASESGVGAGSKSERPLPPV